MNIVYEYSDWLFISTHTSSGLERLLRTPKITPEINVPELYRTVFVFVTEASTAETIRTGNSM